MYAGCTRDVRGMYAGCNVANCRPLKSQKKGSDRASVDPRIPEQSGNWAVSEALCAQKGVLQAFSDPREPQERACP